MIFVLLISCSPDKYEGTYKAENGTFIRLKSKNKFEFGIRRYPELFTGIYKNVGNSIEIIFRYPFFGRDAITTLTFNIDKEINLQIYQIYINAETIQLKINKLENRAYEIIGDETKILPLTSEETQEKLGIFYSLTQLNFIKQENI